MSGVRLLALAADGRTRGPGCGEVWGGGLGWVVGGLIAESTVEMARWSLGGLAGFWVVVVRRVFGGRGLSVVG